MRIRAIARDATKVRADALIVDLFQGVKRPDGATGAVDRALDGAISKLIADGEIKGRFGKGGTEAVGGRLYGVPVRIEAIYVGMRSCW